MSNTIETLRRCIQALDACQHRLSEDVANSEALGTLAELGTTSRAAQDAIETRRELVNLCEMTITQARAHHQELQRRTIEVAQPERQPLTDDQIKEVWRSVKDTGRDMHNAISFARAIEAAHGIKEKP